MLEVGGAGSTAHREYPGTIKAVDESELSFEVPGNVIALPVKEGEWYEKGTVLARLDDRDYRAELDSARSDRNNARVDFERAQTLLKEGVLAKAEYDRRKAAFEVADAAFRRAKKALDDTSLRAPFDGRVARKFVEEHESVLAKQRVMLFQNDRKLEIRVAIPERDLAGARPKAEVVEQKLEPRVVITSIPGRAFPAEVREVAAAADPTTRTFEAKLTFDAPADLRILPGMTAKVVVNVPGSQAAIHIPGTAALGDEQGQAYVWVVDPKTWAVSRRNVTLGPLSEAGVVVREGLHPGDLVAISGVSQLREGMVVRRLER